MMISSSGLSPFVALQKALFQLQNLQEQQEENQAIDSALVAAVVTIGGPLERSSIAELKKVGDADVVVLLARG